LAGAETRDTIPEVMELIASHDVVDAVVYLGLGIQSNQARLMRTGPFYPDHGLERIVAYHERQDERFARAAGDISRATGQPIVDAVGAQRLQSRLDAELGGGQSCVVVNAGSGDVASHNPNLALAPASTEKLLTGLAAMSALGSDFKYETKVVAPAAPANGS